MSIIGDCHLVFVDGFESGDHSAWGITGPARRCSTADVNSRQRVPPSKGGTEPLVSIRTLTLAGSEPTH
jgi:hypothetical protein